MKHSVLYRSVVSYEYKEKAALSLLDTLFCASLRPKSMMHYAVTLFNRNVQKNTKVTKYTYFSIYLQFESSRFRREQYFYTQSSVLLFLPNFQLKCQRALFILTWEL